MIQSIVEDGVAFPSNKVQSAVFTPRLIRKSLALLQKLLYDETFWDTEASHMEDLRKLAEVNGQMSSAIRILTFALKVSMLKIKDTSCC